MALKRKDPIELEEFKKRLNEDRKIRDKVLGKEPKGKYIKEKKKKIEVIPDKETAIKENKKLAKIRRTYDEPIEIPKQLQKNAIRFCFVNCKIPFPTGWQKKENAYKYDDTKLLDRIKKGGSYGVIGGYGNIMIVDADNDKIVDAFEMFGETFTVKTGNGTHLYYYVPGLEKSYSLQEETEDSNPPDNSDFRNIGHITSKGRMVVAPNCKHYEQLDKDNFKPTGKTYEIIKDVDIKIISKEDMMATIAPFLSDKIRAGYDKQKTVWETDKKDAINIDMAVVMKKIIEDHPDYFKKSTAPEGYRGHNPDHPKSKSRMDLTINLDKNSEYYGMWLCSPCSQSGGGYGNALYLIALFEKILHCHECRKGGLRGEKFLQVKKLAIEKYGIPESAFPKKPEKDGKDGKPIHVIPSTINASHEGLNVILTGRIVAEKRQKAIPKQIRWSCIRKCDEGCYRIVDVHDKELFLFRGKQPVKGVVAEMSDNIWRDEKIASVHCIHTEEKDFGHPKWFGTIENYEDYNILWLNDRLEDQKDLKSSENKIRVSLIGVKPPMGRLVEIKGIVVVDPFSSDLSVIAHGIKEIGTTAENLVLDEQTKRDFEKYFKDNAEANIAQIAPDMVGYNMVKLSRLLVLHSPIWIPDLNGKRIRGALRELLFGDTKTNKSKSIKDNIEKYHFGEWYSAETGSRSGLLFYVDTEKKTISWGVMPLNDMGYIGIDSLNTIRKDEWGQFREALEDMRVKVTMAVQGAANIRTRMSTTMNPPKTMEQYLCKCEAIKDTYIFKEKPNITRFDIYLPFSQGDVKDEDVIDREPQKCPIPDDIFSKHIYWAWNLTEDNIKFEQDAKQKIKEETKQILKKYHTDIIPIVHLATRDVLTRLSVAMAVLNHSTDDCINVKVRVEDVVLAATFYINMLVDLDLGIYKNMMEGEIYVNEEEMNEINAEFEMDHYKILSLILTGPKGSPEIARVLNVTPKTIKRKYELLLKYDLIKTIPGKGSTLTRKGVFFVKKRLNIEKPEKTENLVIRRDGNINVPMSLMKQGILSFETLNIDNTNEVGNMIFTIIEKVYQNLRSQVKDLINRDNKEEYLKVIEEKINKVIKEDIVIKKVENEENKNVKKGSNNISTPLKDRDMGTKMSLSTGVEEKLIFFRNNRYSKKIEEVMQTKSRHEWSINDLSFALGFADMTSRKALSKYLDEIAADPKNRTRIRKADKDGLYWRLTEDKKR